MARGGTSSRDAFAPGIRFVAVARLYDRVTLATYRHAGPASLSEYVALAQRVISSDRAVSGHARLTVTDKTLGTIHYDTSRDCFYIIITDPSYPQRAAFKYLAELKFLFAEAHGEALQKAAADGMTQKAKALLAELCGKYDDVAAVEATVRVKREVDEVKEILHGTVNDMLATRENLEVLEDKADDLLNMGEQFHRQGRHHNRNMRWRNRKMCLLGCGTVVFLLLILLAPFLIEVWPSMLQCVQVRHVDSHAV